MVSSREEITHTLALKKGGPRFYCAGHRKHREGRFIGNLLLCSLLENRYIAAGSSIAEPWRDRSRLLEWKREDTTERFDGRKSRGLSWATAGSVSEVSRPWGSFLGKKLRLGETRYVKIRSTSELNETHFMSEVNVVELWAMSLVRSSRHNSYGSYYLQVS